MVFLGGALIPHGAMILDPEKPGLPNGAVELHEKTMEMAREIAALNVEVLVLLTPHGLSLNKDIGVYLNGEADGTAEWNEQWKEFEVKTELSRTRSTELLEAWQSDGVSAQGLMAFSDLRAPLAWAEVIPLWFLKEAGFNGEIVIASIPWSRKRSRMAIDSNCLDEYYHAGDRIAHYCTETIWKEKRVFLGVSGDLAHTHQPSVTDPLYLPDPHSNFKYCTTDAREFDRRFEEWALDSARGKSLESRCIELERTALSCGICGCLILEGALHVFEQKGEAYPGKLFIRCAPTYYAMMSCLFVR
ncbi:uncharacterized protein LOC135825011 [Sycon ciliatum]|uniref:uncharacterized protein LOC135825011 n=1 Tax=Sycon ciliatum TaxID=27933 RepID=UPI0020AA4697